MRFACCDRFYPCFECHRAVADHPPIVWPLSRSNEAAVLCGACGRLLSATEY
ncbi:CHY zinc finger protein, partial [Acinetobacter baumannii]